jgi:hypothetical protein
MNALPDIPYTPESFGVPQEPPKKKRSGVVPALVIVLGGCVALPLCVCLCCVAVLFFSLRQPVTVVTAWGLSLNSNSNTSYDLADLFVCPDSQAADYTNQMRTDLAYFSVFQTSQEGTGDSVEATGTYVENGFSRAWSATLTVGDGGTFGRCVERVDD